MRRLRERRAAGLRPAPDAPPRDPDDLLLPAVEHTLSALGLGSEDAGTVQLCRQYARTLDSCQDPAWGMRWIAPLLLTALESLGATPAARARLPKRGKPREPSGLDKLRAARTDRRGL